MKLPHRRQFLHLATGAGVLSWQRFWPTKPINGARSSRHLARSRS